MSKFNDPTAVVRKTVNQAGGEAFEQSPELSLVSLLLTSFVKDQFYSSEDDQIERVRALVAVCDERFAAKAALFARKEFGMRSITHVVAGEIAMTVKGETWTKDFFDRIVHRPDDMTEILAYYKAANGSIHPVPMALRKGFSTALCRFNDYQLAKYRGDKAGISMVDVVNLVRPHNPTDTIKRLMEGTLKSTDTWEIELSEAGKADDVSGAKKEAWAGLLESGKIGYFALLRNLRNILTDAPESVGRACELLTDPTRIKKSLVLPFRFLTAYEQIEQMIGHDTQARDVLVALSKAVDIACDNVPKLTGRTLVALDVSASMTWCDAAKIGGLFTAVIAKALDSDVLTFDNTAAFSAINPTDSTFSIAKGIDYRGGGTDFRPIFGSATQKYERIIILSDMQAWIGHHMPKDAFTDYKRRTGADPHVYTFDLSGSGSMQFPERNVYALAGFSDKVFDTMGMLEQDQNAMVNRVRQVEL